MNLIVLLLLSLSSFLCDREKNQDKAIPCVWNQFKDSAYAEVLIQMSPGATSAEREAVDNMLTLSYEEMNYMGGSRYYVVSDTFAAEVTERLVENLVSFSGVEEISCNRFPKKRTRVIHRGLMMYGYMETEHNIHNMKKINATDLPRNVYNAASRLVLGSSDTGVFVDHPALVKQYLGYAKVVNITANQPNHDYVWWDGVKVAPDDDKKATPETSGCRINSPIPCDDFNHGTQTTSVALGAFNIGVSPTSKFMACRNMYMNRGRPETYLSCLNFFLNPTKVDGTHPDPNLRPHVILNSYECNADEGCSLTTFQYAMENLFRAGIMMVSAAGNSGEAGCDTIATPPANQEHSITVGALSYGSPRRLEMSSMGPVIGHANAFLDVMAPGDLILTAAQNNMYLEYSGTSMAAAHVAGSVLLVIAGCPHLERKPSLIKQVLIKSATPILSHRGCGSDTESSVPNNEFGFGLINVGNALDICHRFKD